MTPTPQRKEKQKPKMGKKGKGDYDGDYRPHTVKKPKRKFNGQKETHVRGYKDVAFYTEVSGVEHNVQNERRHLHVGF